jgi:hypothetical protein
MTLPGRAATHYDYYYLSVKLITTDEHFPLRWPSPPYGFSLTALGGAEAGAIQSKMWFDTTTLTLT